jgi:hypothetical protein
LNARLHEVRDEVEKLNVSYDFFEVWIHTF